jgi:hypothetical protein
MGEGAPSGQQDSIGTPAPSGSSDQSPEAKAKRQLFIQALARLAARELWLSQVHAEPPGRILPVAQART